jgi:hypothetical protein
LGVDVEVDVAVVLNLKKKLKAKVALKKVAADVIPALKKIADDAPQLPKPPIREVAANVAQVPKLLEVTRADLVVWVILKLVVQVIRSVPVVLTRLGGNVAVLPPPQVVQVIRSVPVVLMRLWGNVAVLPPPQARRLLVCVPGAHQVIRSVPVVLTRLGGDVAVLPPPQARRFKPSIRSRAKNAEAAEAARKVTADVAQVPKLLEVSRAEPVV